jgi:transposase-like protein
VLATAIDVDDNLRLLAMRRVRHANHRAFARILETLTRWRLPARILVIVDDSEGVREAVREHFPAQTPVQRCVDSVVRALTRGLPPELAARSAQAAERAFRLRSPAQAETKLIELAAALRAEYPQAAAALDESLAESLTVKRLSLPASLEEQLCRVCFLASPGPAGASPFAWLSGVFDGLRQRRSVERRRVGLQALATALAKLGKE